MRKKDMEIEIDFDKLVEVFNTSGREAAEAFVEDNYNSAYAIIQRRIKKETNYFFNRNTRKYETRQNTEPNFMTIEELYEGGSKPPKQVEDFGHIASMDTSINNNFKDLMLNLMKDKMQELSKYIYLEQSTKQVLINLKQLEKNGYKVIIS